MSHTSKTCNRGAIRTCPPPSSGRCCLPESGRGTAIRGWYISWRWKQPIEGWLRSIPSWPAQRALQLGESDFAGLFDVLQLGAARAQFLARFGGDVALGYVGAALQAPRFAFERLQPLDRAAHLVDEALLFERIEIDRANSDGNLHARPRHVPLRANVRPLLRFRRLIELRGLLQRGFVQFCNLVDVLERLLSLVGDFFFGQLFVVKLHDLLDRAHALAQVVAHRDQFLDDDRRARDGLHHHELSAFDALRDGDFALARQQRHGAHLAQVHAYGIVCLFQRTRGQIEVAAAFVGVRVVLDDGVAISRLRGHFHGARGLRRRLVLVNLNAVALKCSEEVIDLFRRMHLCRKRIVYFVVEQITALFAYGNELAYCIVFLFKAYCCHKFLPQSDRYPKNSLHRGQVHSQRHAQAGAQAQTTGEFPQKIARFVV